MSARSTSLVVHPPDECARRLGGITVARLIALLKSGGYTYTSLAPGSKPWGRGRQAWGMTDDQIAAVIAGQSKRHPTPSAVPSVTKPESGLKALGWDGIDRLGLSGPPRRRK